MTFTTLNPISIVTSLKGKCWADINDEDDDSDISLVHFPVLKTDFEIKKEEELAKIKEEKSIHASNRAFNHSLSKKREIRLEHCNRTLRVISRDFYQKLVRLIQASKSHDKNGRICRREQEAKIKLANSLFESAYKVPDQPHFIYHNATIYLSDGRVLTRDEIEKGSSAFFELEEFVYKPTA